MKKNDILILSFILIGVIISGGCIRNDYRKTEGMVWNTVYHVTYNGNKELEDSIMMVLNKVGKSLNIFDSASLVSQLNRSDRIIADDNLLAVYSTSREINNVSRRKFDPTLSPLITAWGYGPGHKASTDTLAIDSILKFVGIEKTHLEGKTIKKDDERIQFNFSAIAKGFGCDAIGEMFRRNGVENYMVEIGGELCLSGRSPSGDNWKIAIDSPVENGYPGQETALVVCMTDCGVATSGNYRNFREENGSKTAHTISVETGKPFFSEILSATVVAATCMEADGLATACMASSSEEAKLLLREYGAEGLLIFKDSIWMSPGFRNSVMK